MTTLSSVVYAYAAGMDHRERRRRAARWSMRPLTMRMRLKSSTGSNSARAGGKQVRLLALAAMMRACMQSNNGHLYLVHYLPFRDLVYHRSYWSTGPGYWSGLVRTLRPDQTRPTSSL